MTPRMTISAGGLPTLLEYFRNNPNALLMSVPFFISLTILPTQGHLRSYPTTADN